MSARTQRLLELPGSAASVASNASLQVPAPAAQLTKALAGLRHTFVVADATLPDCPLIYASEGWAAAHRAWLPDSDCDAQAIASAKRSSAPAAGSWR